MAGRPRILTEAKQLQICTLVQSGCTLAAAARFVGCSVLTIQREARRNRDFHQRLRRNQLKSELIPVVALGNAAANDWRAAAWLLERTQPQQYAKRAANSFSPQEVALLLESVCDIIRQETRDAQISARIKRRVLALARGRITRQDENPFRPEFPAPAAAPTSDAAAAPAAPTNSADEDLNSPTPIETASSERPATSTEPSESDQNATEKEPVLICLADIPPRNSNAFAPAYASK